jgi:branched-chain amino acid transport system substrate-binding protein
MKQAKFLLVMVALLAWALPAYAASDKTFPIGAFLPMTGPQAYYGRVMSRGALTAIDQINAAGGVEGYKMNLVITDFKNIDVNLCVTGVRKMISVDKIPVVLASFSVTSLASQPICEKAKVLMINGGAWSPKLVNLPYLHTIRLSQQQMLPAILKYFWDSGARRLGLLYLSDPSGELPMKNTVIPLWTKWGGTIVAEEPHQPGLTDFSAYLTRIRAGKPDAIINLSTGQDIAYAVKGAREIGLTCPISVAEWTDDLQTIAGDTSENVFSCVEYYDRKSSYPLTQALVKDFETKWKEPTDFYSANYYDAVKHLFAELIRRVVKKGGNPLNGGELEEAIWLDPKFDSVYGGKMTLKRDGSVDKPMVIFKVVKGKLTLIKQLTATE